jgi:anti-anti-sigma factor
MTMLIAEASTVALQAPARPSPKRNALTADIVDIEAGAIVRVEGEAGVIGLERLEFAFARLVARRTPLAILDFSQLTFLSSLAMGLLVRLRRDMNRWSGSVRIVNCPATIREALEVASLGRFFGFHDSVEEAIAAI